MSIDIKRAMEIAHDIDPFIVIESCLETDHYFFFKAGTPFDDGITVPLCDSLYISKESPNYLHLLRDEEAFSEFDSAQKNWVDAVDE